MIDMRHLTHGCEHEFADWSATELRYPCAKTGLYRDDKDVTIVNSNGIANDPSLKEYGFGGEICTPPSANIQTQGHILEEIKLRWPTARVNYRSNLHWHIRVPGLKDDLEALKRFARFNAHWLPIILPLVEPISDSPKVPKTLTERAQRQLKGYRRRLKRRRISHHTILPPDRLEKQLAARTVTEFHDAEVPWTKVDPKPMPHAQPRAAVNLRQLLQTDTIEFRHFPGTLDPAKLTTVGQWCLSYIECALDAWDQPQDVDPVKRFVKSGGSFENIPKFATYNHSLEIRYRMTCHDGTQPIVVVRCARDQILAGTFQDDYWDQRLKW